tara:strand:- start:728 stop:1039 length:312 start_codon:yes stop_codon:yes gene_type:complete
MKKFLTTLSFLIIFTNTVNAYTIKGYGANSCGKFLAETDFKGNYFPQGQWIVGYITGLNRQNSLDKGYDFDSTSILYAVKNRCEEKPLEDVEQATNWVYWNEL